MSTTSCIKGAYENKVKSTIQSAGFTRCNKIADTLQGSIWRACHEATNTKVVIKATNKALHSKQLVILNGTKYRVYENILAEKEILKHLSKDKKCPDSIVKYIDSFQSNVNYYLIEEDGGEQLFTFVQRVHELIASNKIDINDWHNMVKKLFKQMIECIEFIHSKNIAHFDFSLENIVINSVNVECSKEGDKLSFVFNDDIQCKLCDFGLAQYFPKGDFISSKNCGKRTYKSPELTMKSKAYNAKSNDIWCLGVSLFMMIIGSAPWHQPLKGDKFFDMIMNGDMLQLLETWKRDHYITDDIMELLEAIFQYEENRITLQEIKKSPWLN